MPSLQPGEVQVQHLHLRGRAPALQRARQSLATAWPSAAWPSTGDDEVLLLRRLRVQGPVARLGDAAAAQARALADQAQGPWGPGADQAAALRFASRAEYQAWQLHQLLRGSVAPPADAVATLLCQVPLALPTVCLLLRRAAPGQAGALWRALDAAGAQRVLSTVAVATGWGRSLAGAGQVVGDMAEPGAGDRSPAAAANAALAEARQVLMGLSTTDARVRLAALLALWQTSPARLDGGDAAPLLRQLARRLVAPAVPGLPPAIATPPVATHRPAAAQPPPPPRPWWVADPPPRGAAQSADPAAGRWPEPAQQATSPPLGHPGAQHPVVPAAPSGQAAAPAGSLAALPPGGKAQDAGTSHFLTTHGGLFFLLQVLGGPLFQRRLLDLNEPQAGWREWLRLAHALGATPDAAWLAFAAQAAQLETPEQASALCWPAATASPLLQAAEARYGSPALQAALAPRPARVLATPSQVDVHFRLADAALAVRRVGLDSDPGWVPWLGRVLRWHYGSALAPGPHDLRGATDQPGPA